MAAPKRHLTPNLTTNTPLGDRRPFFEALVYEHDGSLNLSYVFLMVLLGVVVAGCVAKLLKDGSLGTLEWSFLGTTVMALIIGSIPLNRAKILAKSKLMERVNTGVVLTPTETSTDVQELVTKQSVTKPDNE